MVGMVHHSYCVTLCYAGFPGGASGKEPACQGRRHKRQEFNPGIRKIPWRQKWPPTPVFLLEKFHGQRCLVGYSPWGPKVKMTEYTHTHTHTHIHTQSTPGIL